MKYIKLNYQTYTNMEIVTYLRIETCDNEIICVDDIYIPYFNLLSSAYEDTVSSEDVFPLKIPQGTKKILNYALEWAKLFRSLNGNTEEYVDHKLEEWVTKTFSSVIPSEQERLETEFTMLINLSDFLDSPKLFITLAQRVGHITEEYQSPRELAKRLGVEFDWTPNEYEQMKKVHKPWLENTSDMNID
jgi:hypothetical protein